MERSVIAKRLRDARRIVVKVGTSSLTYNNGKLHIRSMELLVRQLADLKNSGKEILLVSSGAVGAGLGKLDLHAKPREMPKVQALAAIGQGLLMQNYEKFFGEWGVNVAQVLLIKEDFEDSGRYANIRNTLAEIFAYGAVPIINENDVTVYQELKVGDNDTLAALVAGAAEADLLVLLSDIDGLYTANPRTDAQAKMLPVVHGVTPEIEGLAGGTGTELGSGGMMTKVKAAKMANAAGMPMVLANAAEENVLLRLLDGEQIGTVFLP
jgi:glutamate 5-kinase